MKLVRPGILYLSRAMAGYRSSGYQQEVIDELSRQADVTLYGPGYPGYNRKDTINDVLSKTHFSPGFIIVGHSWLSDGAGKEIDPHPALGLDSTDVPIFSILNKEYVNLAEKLEFFTRNNTRLVFSHHHQVGQYSESTSLPFVYWPFAFDHHKYRFSSEVTKDIDLMFSGTLQNMNKHAEQSEIRVDITKSL